MNFFLHRLVRPETRQDILHLVQHCLLYVCVCVCVREEWLVWLDTVKIKRW